MEKPNKLKGVTSGQEGNAGWAPEPTYPGPGGELQRVLPGRPWVGGGSGPHLPFGLVGQGLGPGEAHLQGQGVLWPQELGGVLPPAHHDAKSERGIVCLDAWTLCVHTCS